MMFNGTQWAKGQITSSGAFLTYTNVNYGFTINYPSDWTVNDSTINSTYIGERRVTFTSPDNSGFVFVTVNNQTNETGTSVQEAARILAGHLNNLTGMHLIEMIQIHTSFQVTLQ